MNELILLRHAHALNAAAGQADADRRLSPIGEAEAEGAGLWLKQHKAQPTRVLCSPAQRTRATLERVLGQIGYADARFEPRIYDATPGTLFGLLEEHRDAAGQVLLVGHNPGIETLVALLATGQSGDFRGVPPAGIAWFELGALEPGAGMLKAFWAP